MLALGWLKMARSRSAVEGLFFFLAALSALLDDDLLLLLPFLPARPSADSAAKTLLVCRLMPARRRPNRARAACLASLR